jgi:hypothetical protein
MTARVAVCVLHLRLSAEVGFSWPSQDLPCIAVIDAAISAQAMVQHT